MYLQMYTVKLIHIFIYTYTVSICSSPHLGARDVDHLLVVIVAVNVERHLGGRASKRCMREHNWVLAICKLNRDVE